MKFSQGDWKKTLNGKTVFAENGDESEIVCRVNNNIENSEANLKLILAAPDMFNDLQETKQSLMLLLQSPHITKVEKSLIENTIISIDLTITKATKI